MYFKKLELIGFKSFYEKITLHFEEGITAIVGPNGCGKSNILDAIRWVLGEQSAKSLRGSEMQDVIFSGTDSKEPLGLAEANLTFDNEKRFFNIDNPEVVITRRIFRSGESEYLLNKTPVRLKDILDLLMGTGIGAESYSIVAQGKIELILSSRPEDRRLVFDEASGITKYKTQKRETMRKLEETEQNLSRVNDIIVEVKRQIGSLERQAVKARRYKEVFDELKQKEINLSFFQKKELFLQKDEIVKQLQELTVQEEELLNVIRQQETKITNRQAELKSQEERIMDIRNKILNLENQVLRNNEQERFNKERLLELQGAREHLQKQLEQIKNRLILDEEKLNKVKDEYTSIKKNIEAKTMILSEKVAQLNDLASSITNSQEDISRLKKNILGLVTKITHTKNEIQEFNSKQQIYLARKKRLEIEKAKIYEEKSQTAQSLNNIIQEEEKLKKIKEELNLKISNIKNELEKETLLLNNINLNIVELQNQRLFFESHKEFLEKLKIKYDDINEVLNAVVYLDKIPDESVSGLLIKIKDSEPKNLKLSGEAKPIELDTQKINEKLKSLQKNLDALKDESQTKEFRIKELNKSISSLQIDLRNTEIALANKTTQHLSVLEQFNKIEEEADIIVLELSDIEKEISVLEKNIAEGDSQLSLLNKELKLKEDLITQEEDSILKNSKLKEDVLVIITQTKTELESLNKRITSDETTLKILEDTYNQDKESIVDIEKQINELENKKEALKAENKETELKIRNFTEEIQKQNHLLKENEAKYKESGEGASDVIKKIEQDRKELDILKNKLYELQIRTKDIDYKYNSIRERILQIYKIDLDDLVDSVQEGDAGILLQEIENLKKRLDSLGSVNLVAIEEYDELKKRYDFLIQQQNDLLNAKESLHKVIFKINRTTRQMFQETFEKVKVEFRNYFRLLFNGGDAQVFLIDEQDPLESGIEIICRPPGKKLQNVLLLSGGEKALSAIALLFAIFKVKPSPFCILDEIDAALDEANVDRYARILQEFAKESQFIVITHNKRTITNAGVMYGITMGESGVSKIVSVKFAEDKQVKDKELDNQAVAQAF